MYDSVKITHSFYKFMTHYINIVKLISVSTRKKKHSHALHSFLPRNFGQKNNGIGIGIIFKIEILDGKK